MNALFAVAPPKAVTGMDDLHHELLDMLLQSLLAGPCACTDDGKRILLRSDVPEFMLPIRFLAEAGRLSILESEDNQVTALVPWLELRSH